MTGLPFTLVAAARAGNLRLTAAESCTGGLICAAITDVPGSSTVFDRGFVTYSNQAKTEMLDVSPKTLSMHGAVSEEVAAEMARGALIAARADIAVSVTGIAGPGGTEFKPEGRVCFGLASRAGLITKTVDFGPLGRAAVRASARDHALSMLTHAIGKLTQGR